ncbi:MAG: DUF1553 domain-containing protein [Planctomycetaceae bacterium]|nr:DUF1553 domain-containing protein [Planctomycetaceae bacterium]
MSLFVKLLLPLGLTATVTAGDPPVDFNQHVRPILSDKCYYCHGPDAETRQADLRLDTADGARDIIDSGDFLDRVSSSDPDVHMPPPDSKLTLSSEEKRVLKAWVEQGAQYDVHWAFKQLPAQVDVPATDGDWPQSAVDSFTLQRMQQQGLQPSPAVDPKLWLRRATLDLTGLPPTLPELEAFAAAIEVGSRQLACEQAVDRLLSSPAFGEHMAVAWLDAARYADSYGYQSDKLNTQWPYRDWVVRAFNDNLPYDDFLTWQLAGDLLPNPSVDQLTATAFNRIHRLNNEGGAVFEEWRIENVSDRVHTFGTAVLGLTMECCRCHDHKYDPLSMREYYSLSAFFNSIDESGVYDRTQKVPCPSLLLPTGEQQRQKTAALQRIETLLQQQQAISKDVSRRFTAWKTTDAFDAPALLPDLRLALSFDRAFDNSLKKIYHPSQSDRSWAPALDLIEVTDSPIRRLPDREAADSGASTAKSSDDASTEGASAGGRLTGLPPRQALVLDGERGITTSGIEPFDRWTPFSVVITLKERKRVQQRSLIAHHTRGTDCGYNGWDLTIVDGHLESRLYRVWPGNAIGVRTEQPIPADQWQQIAATYDGSSTAAGLQLFLNGQPLRTTILRDSVKKSANVKVDHGGEFVIGQRFRARGLDGGLIDDVRVYSRDLTTTELSWLAGGPWQADSLDYYRSAIDAPARELAAQLQTARQALVMAEEAMTEIPVMKERAPRPTHVLARGQYDAPTDESTRVERSVPAALGIPFPAAGARNRLGLAEWVTHPDHPLTARVAVNRLWGQFFASSLVTTPENFGRQGALPTHPELLDWLARDFVNHGWDVKRFCRQLVLSATYQQASTFPQGEAKDPENRYLARGSAYRLSAEQIRDIALAASGLLDDRQGGPPVSPYQPGKDLWRESNGMSPPFEQSVGRDLYRRSLYSVWKRTVPLPNMMAFDASTREVCAMKRARTNTPLQALVLLNDVQFVEACRQLAARSLAAAETPEAQIRIAFTALTARTPDAEELRLLRQLRDSQMQWFRKHPDNAGELLSIGDTPAAAASAELAAMTITCQTILNLDATIWKR